MRPALQAVPRENSDVIEKKVPDSITLTYDLFVMR